MSYASRPGQRRPIADINLVPFIDVMLVLLIIFMITAPMLTQGVKVDLPQTSAKAIAEQQEPLIITVNAQGEFFLNVADKPHQAVTARTLTHLVTEELSHPSAKPRAVLVRGDKNVQYGKVVEAMVMLQQAGAKSVGLITQPSSNEPIKS